MSRVITDSGFFYAMNAERSDEMAVFRIERTRDYTVMSNHHLRDKALSLKSKGLLSMMLSLPEDWNYTTRGLAKICKEGVDAIGGALRELEAAGYIVRHQMRDRQGRISDTEYVIYEQPQPKAPDTPQPDTASPDTENPYQYNNSLFRRASFPLWDAGVFICRFLGNWPDSYRCRSPPLHFGHSSTHNRNGGT